MVLKELASCPNSSLEVMGTSWSRLPAPMAAADSVTAWIGKRIVRMVPATSRTARAMPKARPVPYQTREWCAKRRDSLIGIFHLLLVYLQNAAGDFLDIEEHAVKARLRPLAKIEAVALRVGMGEKLVPPAAIVGAERGQFIDQFFFARQGDVVLLLEEALVVEFPLVLVLLMGLFFASRQGELEREIDAFQGFVKLRMAIDAVVILAEDAFDPIAEVADQHGSGSAQRDQQGEQGKHGNQDSSAKGHGVARAVQIPSFFRLR